MLIELHRIVGSTDGALADEPVLIDTQHVKYWTPFEHNCFIEYIGEREGLLVRESYAQLRDFLDRNEVVHKLAPVAPAPEVAHARPVH